MQQVRTEAQAYFREWKLGLNISADYCRSRDGSKVYMSFAEMFKPLVQREVTRSSVEDCLRNDQNAKGACPTSVIGICQ